MKQWQRELANRFDAGDTASIESSLHEEERAYLAGLRRLREGSQAVATRAQISDGQMRAFMHGIREGIETRPSYRRFWALLSLTTAALLVASSAFLVLTWHKGDPKDAYAASTQIPGATVDSYSNTDGTQYVWVNLPRRDLP